MTAKGQTSGTVVTDADASHAITPAAPTTPPATPPTTPPSTPPTTPPTTPRLPQTGTEASLWLGLGALALLGVGTTLVVRGRLRRH